MTATRPTVDQFRVLGALAACGADSRDRAIILKHGARSARGLFDRGLVVNVARGREVKHWLTPNGVTFTRLVPSCRRCGCTEDRACPGGCAWAEPFLCTACEDGD